MMCEPVNSVMGSPEPFVIPEVKPEPVDIADVSTAVVSSSQDSRSPSLDSESSSSPNYPSRANRPAATGSIQKPIVVDLSTPIEDLAGNDGGDEAEGKPVTVVPKIKIRMPRSVALSAPSSAPKKRSSETVSNLDEDEKDAQKVFGSDTEDEEEPWDWSDGEGTSARAAKSRYQKPKNAFEEVVAKLAASSSRKRFKAPKARDLEDTACDVIDLLHDAAEQDREANRARKPAMAKMMALEKVLHELKKPGVVESFVINNGASALKEWFDRLPDGSCPNARLTEELLKLVDRMPLTKAHMIESRLGQSIADVWRSRDQPYSNRQRAKGLVDEWVRDTFGISYCESSNRMRRQEEVMAKCTPQFVDRAPEQCGTLLAPMSPRAAERRHPRMLPKAHRLFTINVIGDVDGNMDLKRPRKNLDAKLRHHEMMRKRRKL